MATGRKKVQYGHVLVCHVTAAVASLGLSGGTGGRVARCWLRVRVYYARIASLQITVLCVAAGCTQISTLPLSAQEQPCTVATTHRNEDALRKHSTRTRSGSRG